MERTIKKATLDIKEKRNNHTNREKKAKKSEPARFMRVRLGHFVFWHPVANLKNFFFVGIK
jgi:hypothetical protein